MKKMEYKSVDQLVKDNDERSPLSTRVKVDTKSLLEKEAKVHNITISTLAAAILDDYALWLQSKKKGAK